VEEVGKQGFLLLVGIFVLVVAACTTTNFTPGVTASGLPRDDQSASAGATGTPDDQYQALIGEWRGYLTNGFTLTLIIQQIDVAKGKARCTYSVRGLGIRGHSRENLPVRADFMPGLSPKLKWVSESGRRQWEFVLKDNVLEGSQTLNSMFGPTVAATTKMEKYLKK
jgi:hypothetical protein